jgi:hypothetical protein
MAAAAGCQLNRTGHGYMLRGQWSLECNHTTGCAATNSGDNCSEISACPTAQSQEKPELLPWRSRLKARIGARLLHREELDDASYPDESSAVSPIQPIPSAPSPEPLPTPPANPSGKKQSKPSTEASGLKLPKSNLMKPESWRPDLVME